jgi:hypothetical protein
MGTTLFAPLAASLESGSKSASSGSSSEIKKENVELYQ